MSITGKLRRNTMDRWEVADGEDVIELSCGNLVEILIDGHWIKTRIEHDGSEYYAVTHGVMLTAGLPARTA